MLVSVQLFANPWAVARQAARLLCPRNSPGKKTGVGGHSLLQGILPNPGLQYSCLENPRDRGAWRAAIHGVAQSQTRLKQLSSSSRDQPVSRALQAVFTIWVTREAQFLKILEFQMGSTKPEVIRSPFSKGGCDVTFIEKRVKQSKEIIWWAVA